MFPNWSKTLLSFYKKDTEDMDEESHSHHQQYEGFAGPIETGKTGYLPHSPVEENQIYSDLFALKCDHIDIQPKSIVLPKLIFKMDVLGYKEKGFLLLTFDSNYSSGIHAKILKAADVGFKNFQIHFYSQEDNQNLASRWDFENARIHAVDFGFAANERNVPAEVAVEIDYKHLNVDGVSV